MTELRVFTTGIMGSVPTAMYWVLLAVFCVGLILFLWKKGLREGLRASAVLLLVEWIILVLGIAVIFREPRTERSFCLIPLLSYFDYGTNSYFMEKAALNILNVVLFLPVGFLLKLSNVNVNRFGFRIQDWTSSEPANARQSKRVSSVLAQSQPSSFNENKNKKSCLNINWKGAMVVGLLISVVIEVLQFVFKRGLCEVDDVIHNVLGCMIGYGVANVIKKLTIDN